MDTQEPTPFVDPDRLTVAGKPIRVTSNIYDDLKASIERYRVATLEAIRQDRKDRR